MGLSGCLHTLRELLFFLLPRFQGQESGHRQCIGMGSLVISEQWWWPSLVLHTSWSERNCDSSFRTPPSWEMSCRSVMWHSFPTQKQSLLIATGIKDKCSPKLGNLGVMNWQLCSPSPWVRTFASDALQSSKIHKNTLKGGNCLQFPGSSQDPWRYLQEKLFFHTAMCQLHQQHLIQH